jgi:hypothetical protein
MILAPRREIILPGERRCRRCGKPIVRPDFPARRQSPSRRGRWDRWLSPAMSGDLVQVGADDKVRVKTGGGVDGVVVAGASDACCCTALGTCALCGASPPLNLTVTVAGLTPRFPAGCCNQPPGAGSCFQSEINGTYTVTDDGHGACSWSAVFPFFRRVYSPNTDCSGSFTSLSTNITVGVTRASSTGWLATVSDNGALTHFSGSATVSAGSDCSGPISMTNTVTTGSPLCAGVGGCAWGYGGGSVTITG